MLPEDRLQMKWREPRGGGLGYLVQVTPTAGKAPGLAAPGGSPAVCHSLQPSIPSGAALRSFSFLLVFVFVYTAQ